MIKNHDGFKPFLKQNAGKANRHLFACIILFAALIITYGNSFDCAWHLDDFPNIVDNTNVHLKSFSWENLIKTFHGFDTGHKKVSRPLAYLTFAVNYYLGGINVFGYHAFNFTVHYFATVFLFLLLYHTLQLPLLNERYRKTAYAIALLATFIWAVHPIQVTAVTYIVQRMASMAGMFYIMTIYLYLKARTAQGIKRQAGLFVLCGIVAFCSFACKENGAMLPASILLYDIFLIQGFTAENVKKNKNIIVILLLLSGAAIYISTNLTSILNGYAIRSFSLAERLLTEPRVILFYVTLLLYPVNTRLTLLHDFEISRSLFAPWTTLPVISILLALIVTAVWLSKKRPLIAYCILFFFANHLIEGSIIPLELIYEHRNYLPSMFIFVPVAILIVHGLDYFSYKKSVQSIMAFTLMVTLSAFGHTTYIRNALFKDEITLWYDNVKKAPQLTRPHHNLGKALFVAGFYDEAYYEMQAALNAGKVARKEIKHMTHFNLGVFYLVQNEYNKAFEYFLKSIDCHPHNPKAYNAMAVIMFCENDLGSAEKYIKKAIRLDPDSQAFRKNLDWIVNRREKGQAAAKEEKETMLKQIQVNE